MKILRPGAPVERPFHASKSATPIPGSGLSEEPGRKYIVLGWGVCGFVHLGFGHASTAAEGWMLCAPSGPFLTLTDATRGP